MNPVSRYDTCRPKPMAIAVAKANLLMCRLGKIWAGVCMEIHFPLSDLGQLTTPLNQKDEIQQAGLVVLLRLYHAAYPV